MRIRCPECGYEFDTRSRTGVTHCGSCYARIVFDRELFRKYKRDYRLKNLEKVRAWGRDYYKKHRDRIRACYALHRDEILQRRRENYAKNIEKMRAREKERRLRDPDRVKRWRQKNRARVLKYKRNQFRKKKAERVAILGGKCQICGYNECIAALTLHHKNPQEKEREKDWLKKDFDPSKYVLLCANCHLKLHWESGPS